MKILVLFAVIFLNSNYSHAMQDCGISNANIIKLLLVSNQKRASVYPSGTTNMRFMKWSSALAERAQEHADKCTDEHSDSADEGIGENLASATSGDLSDPSTMVTKWYDEEQWYDYETTQCTADANQGQSCGHYLQLVKADADEMGCGFKTCSKLGDTGKSGWFLVCNYNKGIASQTARPYSRVLGCPDDLPTRVPAETGGDNALCAPSGGACAGVTGTFDRDTCVPSTDVTRCGATQIAATFLLCALLMALVLLI